jgi:hypothetical protein
LREKHLVGGGVAALVGFAPQASTITRDAVCSTTYDIANFQLQGEERCLYDSHAVGGGLVKSIEIYRSSRWTPTTAGF